MDISFIVASHDEDVLRSSLLASPDLAGEVEVSVHRHCASAALAYNQGIDSTRGAVMVFVHQDVYLPADWLARVRDTLAWLAEHDPDWGVVGAFGMEKSGAGQGLVYSTGLGRCLGSDFTGARRVETLDEVLLILRRASGLRFDESLPGFHLYGADVCLEAEKRGMGNYAISACAIHNSNGIGIVPWAYWRSYRFMRRKWWSRLPVQTPCMAITKSGAPALRYVTRSLFSLATKSRSIGTRVADPSLLWAQISSGRIAERLGSASRRA
jgi:Glycosyltransferase like family